MSGLSYQQAIDHLLALVDHERTQPAGPRQKRIYDLGRMYALLERMGNPHRAARTVHVAGTKGKGSVAAMCDAVLHAAGYRTGFYSSPHLHTFRERIRRDSHPITEGQFAGLVEKLWPYQEWVKGRTELGAVSLFEFMTAMAFQCFADDAVDFQTIEVGLGGRLDATNVVNGPSVCIITPISLDHMAILGDTIPEIAAEKAGIIKEGAPVVVAPQPKEALEVILSVCQRLNARPVLVGREVTWEAGAADLKGQEVCVKGRLGEYRLRVPLLGEYQLGNAATAVAALEILREAGYPVSDEAMAQGFAAVSWPCRLEVLRQGDYLVLADGAHNDHSVRLMLESLSKYFDYRRLVVIAGFSRDKGIPAMVKLLADKASVVLASRSRHPRSLAPYAVAQEFQKCGVRATETASIAEALRQAQAIAQPGDLVLGTGSLFVAAELREALLGITPELYPDLLPVDLRDPSPGHDR